MTVFLERFTLWCGLYGVTLSILLTEGVDLPRAAAWAVLASSMKFLVVHIHQRLWSCCPVKHQETGCEAVGE